MGEEKYLQEVERRYPKWRRYEGLNEEEKTDHGVSRNFNETYWEKVKNGCVDFPELPGRWLVVETMP